MQFFLVVPKGNMYYEKGPSTGTSGVWKYIYLYLKKGLELHDQLLCVKKTPDLHLHKLESIRWI